jgi:DNA-binding XRE family transcriptional regulator
MTLPFDWSEFSTHFGKRLRATRALREMNQFELAHRAGYAKQTISNLERGLCLPSLTTAFTLAEVLDVHPQDLLFGDEE